MSLRLTILLARKDLRMLLRSRALLLLVVAYPLLVAAVAGAVFLSTGSGATVGIVNESGIEEITLGDERFSVDGYLAAVADEIEVESFDTADEAFRALDDGQLDGVLVIPANFRETAEALLAPATLRFYTGDNALGDLIAERARGAIYVLNQDLSQQAIGIVEDDYLDTMIEGGTVVVGDLEVPLVGLTPAIELLEDIQEDVDEDEAERIEAIVEFAGNARSAIGAAGGTLEATASPVKLERVTADNKSPALTSRALAFVAALVTALLCAVVTATSTASERDEGVGLRLLQGTVGTATMLASKLLLGALLGIVATLGLFVAFAVVESQQWVRMPLLLFGAVLAGLAFAALGAVIATLTADGRSAALATVLVVLPLVPLGAVENLAVVDLVNVVLPFRPAVDLLNAILFEASPWRPLLTGAAHLLAISAALALIGWRRMGRLALR